MRTNLRRHRVLNRVRADRIVLGHLRGICSSEEGTEAVRELAESLRLAPEERKAFQRLADDLKRTAASMMPPEAPYLSDFEARLMAVLGNLQRLPGWRFGIPPIEGISEGALATAAEALRARSLFISHPTILQAVGSGVAGAL